MEQTLSFTLVCFSYPPVLGGSEIEAQRVCQAMRQRGHRVRVICAGLEEMPAQPEWVDPFGTPVRIIGKGVPRRWLDHVFALGVAWELWKHRNDAGVVYFLMQGLHLVTGLPVCRLLGLPILMKISGSGIIPIMQRSVLGRLELRWLRQWARRIMLLNEGMMQEAEQAGFERRQLYWMPNPVDIGEFCPLPVKASSQTVIFVGRLAPEKELGSLLDAFALLKKRVPTALLHLVGDGPDAEQLRRRCTELGLDGTVRFLGRLPMPEVIRNLQHADVFALISSLEGFPCSLVEAMSCGLPSVVSDIPANRQLVEDGVTGLLVELKNPEAIAAAIERLLADAALRETLGAASRRLVEGNYGTAEIAARYEKLMREASA